MTITPDLFGWSVLDGTLEEVIAREPDPLAAVLRSQQAAVVVRDAYPRALCELLVRRFYELGLLYDPATRQMRAHRVNIGTALGWTKSDPDVYFAAAAAAADLFACLFADVDNPIEVLYGTLTTLGAGAPVRVAREPDGRTYGAAIVRAYHADVGHQPHYDKLVDLSEHSFVVSHVRQQLAVVLCLQNPDADADPPSQPILYDVTGGADWDACLEEDEFKAMAARRGVKAIQIRLNPGDLYVFRSSTIHEVPPVRGRRARIVLAAFLGDSEKGDEFVVWS